MWILLPLLAAIGFSLISVRRIRLVRERRERTRIMELVEGKFERMSQESLLPEASDLVRAIRSGKRLRVRLLNPELEKLETALSSASQWSREVDPEQERKAVLEDLVHLYVKWRDVRASL